MGESEMGNAQSNTIGRAIDHEREFFKRLCSDIAAQKVELPIYPESALRIKKVLDDPTCSINSVVNAVLTDAVLSASLIRIANSAAFNTGHGGVSDLRGAVSRIGLDMTRNTAVSIAMKQVFNPDKATHLETHLKHLWNHSLRVAAIAYVLPNKPSSIKADEALLAGLVHDIGKLYILMRADKHPELFNDEAALKEIMRLWHPGVGKVILESWGFPEEVALAADEHETLNQAESRGTNLTDVIIASNLLSYIGGSTPSPYKGVNFLEIPSFERLQINDKNVINVLVASKEKIKSLVQALN